MAIIVKDPTLNEMRQLLTEQLAEAVASDREEAAFWFAFQWADADHPNLTAALEAAAFTPAPSANGPMDDWAQLCLITLETEYLVEE